MWLLKSTNVVGMKKEQINKIPDSVSLYEMQKIALHGVAPLLL